MNEPKQSPTLRERFQQFARVVSNAVGSVWAFLLALGIIAVCGLTGPYFHYSDTWQLVQRNG